MPPFLLGLVIGIVIGLFVGNFLGILALALCIVSGQAANERLQGP